MKVEEIIELAGGVTALASEVGVHHTSVIGWRKQERIPASRVKAVSEASGVPKHEIRPDLYSEAAA